MNSKCLHMYKLFLLFLKPNIEFRHNIKLNEEKYTNIFVNITVSVFFTVHTYRTVYNSITVSIKECPRYKF